LKKPYTKCKKFGVGGRHRKKQRKLAIGRGSSQRKTYLARETLGVTSKK